MREEDLDKNVGANKPTFEDDVEANEDEDGDLNTSNNIKRESRHADSDKEKIPRSNCPLLKGFFKSAFELNVQEDGTIATLRILPKHRASNNGVEAQTADWKMFDGDIICNNVTSTSKIVTSYLMKLPPYSLVDVTDCYMRHGMIVLEGLKPKREGYLNDRTIKHTLMTDDYVARVSQDHPDSWVQILQTATCRPAPASSLRTPAPARKRCLPPLPGPPLLRRGRSPPLSARRVGAVECC